MIIDDDTIATSHNHLKEKMVDVKSMIEFKMLCNAPKTPSIDLSLNLSWKGAQTGHLPISALFTAPVTSIWKVVCI